MSGAASTSITDLLADFSTNLRYADIPAAVRAEARDGIRDSLGVALCGAGEPGTSILLEAANGGCGPGSATVVGHDDLVNTRTAATVNSYSAHALDYDDTQHVSNGHMSAPVFPAALAVAELSRATGSQLLTAYVVGFEVASRLSRVGGFGRHLGRRGVHSTGYLGHFGATAAAAHVLGSDVDQMRHGFGIVGGQASGGTKSFGTMSKAMNAANAAGNGVISAQLAHGGFTGAAQIFDGERSVFGMFDFTADPSGVAEGLGTDFEISYNTFKQFACAGWRNPIIEAVLAVSAEHELVAEDISAMNVTACRYVAGLPNYPEPKTGLEAKFSAEHAAAIAVVDRAGGVQQFTTQRARDPRVVELRRRTTLDFDDELGDFQIRVHIGMADGREYSHFVAMQKGDHRNPLTKAEMETKFRANASVLPPDNVDCLLDMLNDLEAVVDAAELTRLCRPGEKP